MGVSLSWGAFFAERSPSKGVQVPKYKMSTQYQHYDSLYSLDTLYLGTSNPPGLPFGVHVRAPDFRKLSCKVLSCRLESFLPTVESHFGSVPKEPE